MASNLGHVATGFDPFVVRVTDESAILQSVGLGTAGSGKSPMPLSPPPERVDPMHRQIAGKLTGPVTKWFVLVAVPRRSSASSGSFARQAHQRPEQRGRVVAARRAPSRPRRSSGSRQFQDPNDLVTTVVYYKASGLTDEDLAAIESHGAEIAKIEGVSNVITPQGAATAGIPAPYVSEDGQVAKLDFTINRGDALWEDMPDVADEIRDLTAIDGVEVYVAGAGGTTADQAAAFAGMDGRLLLITLGAVILILLVSYRSPVLWALPIFCAVVSLGIAMGVLYLLAKYADMTINGQTPVHHDRAGDRRRDGLRPAAGRPIPRGAPPPRGPARGDGVRPAPRRTGHLRQRHDRRRRPAVPDVRRAQLHRRPRPGQRGRRWPSPSSSW